MDQLMKAKAFQFSRLSFRDYSLVLTYTGGKPVVDIGRLSVIAALGLRKAFLQLLDLPMDDSKKMTVASKAKLKAMFNERGQRLAQYYRNQKQSYWAAVRQHGPGYSGDVLSHKFFEHWQRRFKKYVRLNDPVRKRQLFLRLLNDAQFLRKLAQFESDMAAQFPQSGDTSARELTLDGCQRAHQFRPLVGT